MQVLSKVTDCHISFFSVSICQELSLSLSTVREFMIPKKLTNRAIVLASAFVQKRIQKQEHYRYLEISLTQLL